MAHTRTCGGWRWCTVVHVSPEHVEGGAGIFLSVYFYKQLENLTIIYI